ncbi:oocyst wall protein 2 [Cryptosporidium canis]|uniref:Oocyst wall protein 2 n=1 Tax=Cryptosporidium canis TaxID=195482 RepID=A0ABQ8PC43_9CRYT|nr:oocyst wall protein 2 [Cryptosporidium canis]KAJ1615532.1 oocyst wall protein 2 [Cryptosporidium canis]
MFLFVLLVCFLVGSFLSISSLIFLVLLVIRTISKKRLNNYETTRNIAVLVVGDIGRSPRMQNHALCISKKFCSREEGQGKSNRLLKRSGSKDPDRLDDKVNNNHVYLVGYDETMCSSAITGDKNITILGIGKTVVDKYRKVLPMWVFLLIKLFEQSLKIFIAMIRIPNLSGILLQVPPSLPSIPIALMVSFIRGAPLIIDWHNYGHTLLLSDAKRASSSSIFRRIYQYSLVKSYEILEFSLGRLSHSAFCVSKAMQEDLKKRGIQATVVYDRPNDEFRPMESVFKRHSVLFKYFGQLEGGCNQEPVTASTSTDQTVVKNKEERGKKQKHKSKECQKNTPNSKSKDVQIENNMTDNPSSNNVQDVSLDTRLESVLEKPVILEEINKQLKDRVKTSAKNSSISGSLLEQEFLLEIKPDILEAISPNFKKQDLRQLLTRDDLFFDNSIFETSPVTELGITCDQIDNNISLKVQLRKNRPAVLITSTSWTPDEDLNLLLDGLMEYDGEVSKQAEKGDQSEKLPNILLIITGKGPNKQSWLEAASKTNMKHVEIKTVFVEADDYPRLLASSDLGISMHLSSSGLDLPMKVVDMLGAGIPVISFSYPTINELLKSDKTELFFSNSHELCSSLTNLLQGFDSSSEGSLFLSPNLHKILKSNSSRKRVNFYQEWSNTAIYHFDEMVI